MPRPSISFWSGQLFRRQLNAVLDWMEANSSGGGKVSQTGDTMTGPLVTAAPGVAAGLLLTPGAADPSSPTDGEIWRRTADMRAKIGSALYSFAFLNGASTFTGKKTFSEPINVYRAAAPASPVNGDFWVDDTGAFAHVNGVTVQLG